MPGLITKVTSQPKKPRRSEQEIFSDLSALCKSPGYVHLVAYVCFRDNIVGIGEELTAKDLARFSSPERLIRTEISTLIGLMIQGDMVWDLPKSADLQTYLIKTDALLKELHETIASAGFAYLDPSKLGDPSYDPMSHGEVLREAIFYGGESAFISQYRDFSVQKYRNDNPWLEKTKGFSIETATAVIVAIGALQSTKVLAEIESMRSAHPDTWTFLPGFTFTASEVVSQAGASSSAVEAVLHAFTLPKEDKNLGFRSLTDFNVANATPILQTPSGEFVSFQTYSLVEALYDSPFYWMVGDASYRPAAMQNRGDFTESFCRERLELVFGKDRVFQNVDLIEGKDKVGEIDVLVIFGNRAIILQAKAKRLTLGARKGNDLQIRDDFKKSVQDAYDQGLTCAKRLSDSSVRLEAKGGHVVSVPAIKETYIVSVVSDYYPALTAQARQFLKYETSATIQPPLVSDVFLVDVMTEMLRSPLYFLSYLNRRVNYIERLMAQELTILAYHLKQNLWLKDEHQLVVLHDDISADLDVAMAVRREGVKGKATPDGILTRFVNTPMGRLLSEIEDSPTPGVVDLGFLLLTLSEDAVLGLSNAITKLSNEAKKDGLQHDVTVTFADSGLTVHINDGPQSEASRKLQGHCELRKYAQKANTWYGICLSATGALRFGMNSNRKWEQDAEMDQATKGMPAPGKLEELVAGIGKKRKVGRNDPCPCGSGRKYKKCHGPNWNGVALLMAFSILGCAALVAARLP